MEHQNKINFFWSGDDWTYLHDLTIKSHISVGHKPIMWLHGLPPNSKYWDMFGVEVRDADEVVNITSFMKKGGNFKTASSLWRFRFLFEYGGWYSDTDAVALSKWPDQDWVLCNDAKGLMPTGVIKVPKREYMFLDMIRSTKHEWGNVKVFTDIYRKFKKNTRETVNSKLFYPFEWVEWEQSLSEDVDIKDKCFKCYSIHLYHTMFERADMIDNIEEWIKQNPQSLLSVVDCHVKQRLLGYFR